MNLDFTFFFNAILIGIGLAMDAFSVSLANGLNEPKMKNAKMCGVAATFGIVQGFMPFIGWLCVHTVAQYFTAFEVLIPWIALALLSFIGGKMLYESIKEMKECKAACQGDEACELACEFKPKTLGLWTLIVQGIATSIDALSVGFTIAEYNVWEALIAATIIAAVTFFICLGGIMIGKKTGTVLAGKAGLIGGAILIFIGLEIFITSWF